MTWNSALIDTSSLQYKPWQVIQTVITPNPQIAKTAFRPPDWGREQPLNYIEDDEGTMWFFDAVLKLLHNHSQRITQHPVQTGANITDHSFSLPARLTMEIGMSDVMDSYIPSQWGSDASEPTKSVMAFQTLLDWKNNGVPLLIRTRLNIYENMVIANIHAPEDFKTRYALKALVTFQQIFTTELQKAKVSTRPAVTEASNLGNKQNTPITGSILSNLPPVPGVDDLKDAWFKIKSDFTRQNAEKAIGNFLRQ